MTSPQKPSSIRGSNKANLQKSGSGIKPAPASSLRAKKPAARPVIPKITSPAEQPDPAPSLVNVGQSDPPIVTVVVDESSTKSPKTVDYNPAQAHDETRHLIVNSLLQILTFVFCAALLFCFLVATLNDQTRLEHIERILPVIDHYLSLLITLLSGVIGFYFGSKINSKK